MRLIILFFSVLYLASFNNFNNIFEIQRADVIGPTSEQDWAQLNRSYSQSQMAYRYLRNGDFDSLFRLCDTAFNNPLQTQLVANYQGYIMEYFGTGQQKVGNYYLSEKSRVFALVIGIMTGDQVLKYQAWQNIASLFMISGKGSTAYRSYVKLLRKRESLLYQSDQANIYSNLAALGIRLQDKALCDSSFAKVFELMKKPLNSTFAPFIALRNYGCYHLWQNQPDSARFYLNLASREALDSVGENHYQAGICLNHLGEIYTYVDDSDSAGLCFEKALAILKPEPATSDSLYPNAQYETVYIETLINYGDLSLSQNDHPHALSQFQSAVDRLIFLSHAVNAESSRFILAEKGRPAFNMAISTALQLYNQTQDAAWFDQAFEWSLQARSLSLNWMLEQDLYYSQAGLPTSMVSRLKELRKALDEAIIMDTEPTLTVSLDSVSHLIRAYEKTEEQIRLHYAEIMRAKKKESALMLFNKSIRPREKYLGYFQTDSLLWVFTVKKHVKTLASIPIDANLEQLIQTMKHLLTNQPPGNYTQHNIDHYQQVSHQLYALLVDPFIEKGDRSLLIHPDGLLLGLPFEALTQHNEPMASFRALPYLFYDYHIRYTTTQFLNGPGKQLMQRHPKLALITCDEIETAANIRTEAESLLHDFDGSELFFLGSDSSDFQKLLATKDAIHLSSHIAINREDLFNTGLGCLSADSGSLLTFRDILYLNIPGTPVFINGCESGAGTFNQGEGLMSLALAFSLSGSRTIIQHLWKASDLAASEIAGNYYRSLTQNNYALALQKAKKAYLQNCKSGYDHPWYWAGVVCFGEGVRQSKSVAIMAIIAFLVLFPFGFWIYRKRIVRKSLRA